MHPRTNSSSWGAGISGGAQPRAVVVATIPALKAHLNHGSWMGLQVTNKPHP